MFKFHFKRGLIFAILGLAVGGTIAMLTPKVYEASAELLLGDATVSSSATTLAPDVLRILGVGQASDSQTELQILKSQSIFFQALRNVARDKNEPDLMGDFVRYFLMYDVLTPDTKAGAEVKGSVATIRVRANNRDIAQEIARQITEVYNEFRTTNARNGLQNAIRYLSAQEVASKKVLDEAETKYKNYAAENGIVNIEQSNATATQLEGAAMTRLIEAKALKQGADAEVASLEQALASIPKNVAAGEINSRSQTVSQLESQIAQGRLELDRLRSRYLEDHPRVQEVAKSVRSMDAQLKKLNPNALTPSQSGNTPNPVYQGLQSQLASAKARAEGYQYQVQEAENFRNEVRERLRSLPTNEGQIRQLARDQVLADQNFRRIKIQLDDLRTRQDSSQVAAILAPAQAYTNPVAPDVSKFLFIGTLAGLCLGLIYSFAVEAMKLRVHTSHQLAELTGLPVVATIPAMGRSQQKGLKSYAQPGAKPNESFRHMGYTFMAKNHAKPRLIMITGVGSVPGRTSSAVQFALALANSGNRVLLVDCDPVRSLATRAFDAEGKSGLSELFDRGTLPTTGEGVVLSTPHDNLLLLPVGADVSKGLADRSTEQMDAVLAFLKASADIIVFDAPPCDMFSDASRLAGSVDEVCLVVSASTTNYAQIPNGYELLTRAGAKEVSLILTDASPNEEAFAGTKNYSKGA